jgi:UDP-N-acetyl-D-galactosamine dehydrogenase
MSQSRVAILGLTFKENIADIRNSRVPDIVRELALFGITASVCDPMADDNHVRREYDLKLVELQTLHDLDAIILAVPHRHYVHSIRDVVTRLKPEGVLIDVKSVIPADAIPPTATYWSL